MITFHSSRLFEAQMFYLKKSNFYSGNDFEDLQVLTVVFTIWMMTFIE